jgi:peptidyl-prolyl cis-trans isomerase C
MRQLRKKDLTMTLNNRSRLTGTRLTAALSACAAMLAAGTLSAQTIDTVNGAEITADVFNMYLESRIQKPAAQATPTERTRFMEELKDIYLLTTQPRAKTLSEMPRNKAMMELQTRGILAQAVAADFIENNTASDEEIQAAYKEQIALAPPQEFKASHILVESQSEANSIVAELEGGANFADLAKAKSTGPSGPNGGDLGWFSPNQMVAPFSEAVAGLEDGAFSKTPVQTQFGWHVIFREDSRDATPPTLESVRDVIKQRVEQQKLQDYLEGLRATLKKG